VTTTLRVPLAPLRFLPETKANFRQSCNAWKAWAELEELP
jgi:hypothetical protein